MDVAPVSKTLTQEMINAYGDASGDHNPIHVDVEFARTTELGGTIAHGMLVLASLSEMMTAAFGAAWLRAGKLDVRFRAPARPQDTITASAALKGEENVVLTYAVQVVNQAGDLLISGTAEVKQA
jgi:3-hydroxybutyryl-CoA dehydratase